MAGNDLLLGLTVWVAVVTVGTWTRRAPLPLLNDDVAYLVDACGRALGVLEWGPGYAALYCGLRQAFTDPLTAFWAKQSAVPLLAGLLVHRLGFVFGLGHVIPPLSGLWCVLAMLAVNGTVEFAFVLGLMACLCAASRGRLGWVGFFGLMGLAFLVRVEYLVGTAAALALLLRHRDGAARWSRTAGAVVLAGGLLAAGLGRAASGPRSWFAFGQQFAVNYAEARGLDVDPFVEWQRVAGRAFPTSRSIVGAARENPRMLVWHLGYNVLVRTPRAVAAALVPVPSFVPWVRGREMLAAAAVLLFVLAATVGARSRERHGPPILPLLALATIPAVSLIFRPQARHLLPLLPLAIIVAGTGLRKPPGERPPRLAGGLRLAFAGVLLIGLASPWAFWARTPAPIEASLDGWIRELRREARARPVRLLASWYVDRACRLVGPDCRPVSLADFIAGHEVDVALVGPDWAAQPEVQRDARVREFVSRPEELGCAGSAATPDGFRLVRCPRPLRLAPARPPSD
jgi:hypothetical protein